MNPPADTTQDTSTATNDAGALPTADLTKTADTTQAATTAPETKPPAETKDTTPAPAEVEYKFDAPEGVELNQEDLAKFTEVVKELELPAEAAKKLFDIAASREVARAEAFSKQVADWATEVKADKELGTPENLAIAKSVVDAFGTPETKDLLTSTGMGNHPVLVRFLLNVGKAISEDTFRAGRDGGAPPPARDHASILYGNTPTK